MTPGALTVDIGDDTITISVTGGAVHRLPVGPLTLLAGPLHGGDPPPPADLTNALGLVHDHLDDLLILAPSVAAAPAVTMVGAHAVTMARVEIGADHVPPGYDLQRADADEVFRTLAAESIADRRHNPGLPDEHVESILATCCVILGIMRRLELRAVHIGTATSAPTEQAAAD